jgi:hypothetical protein
MAGLDDIERAIAQLSEADLAKLWAWFEDFDAHLFDEKIERVANRAGWTSWGGRRRRRPGWAHRRPVGP